MIDRPLTWTPGFDPRGRARAGADMPHVVRPVPGHVDLALGAFENPLSSNAAMPARMAPEIEVRLYRSSGGGGDGVGKAGRGLRAVDQGPGHDRLLPAGAGPLHIGDRDPAEQAAGDRLGQGRIGRNAGDIAIALGGPGSSVRNRSGRRRPPGASSRSTGRSWDRAGAGQTQGRTARPTDEARGRRAAEPAPPRAAAGGPARRGRVDGAHGQPSFSQRLHKPPKCRAERSAEVIGPTGQPNPATTGGRIPGAAAPARPPQYRASMSPDRPWVYLGSAAGRGGRPASACCRSSSPLRLPGPRGAGHAARLCGGRDAGRVLLFPDSCPALEEAAPPLRRGGRRGVRQSRPAFWRGALAIGAVERWAPHEAFHPGAGKGRTSSTCAGSGCS